MQIIINASPGHSDLGMFAHKCEHLLVKCAFPIFPIDVVDQTGRFRGKYFLLIMVCVSPKAPLSQSHLGRDKSKLLGNFHHYWEKSFETKQLLLVRCCRRRWRPEGWRLSRWTWKIIGNGFFSIRIMIITSDDSATWQEWDLFGVEMSASRRQ